MSETELTISVTNYYDGLFQDIQRMIPVLDVEAPRAIDFQAVATRSRGLNIELFPSPEFLRWLADLLETVVDERS